MELRATREMRRSEQLAKAMAKKADAEPPAKARPQPAQAPTDKVSLSRQALAFVQEQNQRMWEQAQEREQRRQGRLDDSLSALEASKKQLDAMGEKLKVQDKCQKIAAAIMRGDRVPPEDLEYLMNNDPEGYKLAMAMRREKKDPEDVESVLDEEDKNGAAEESGNGDTPAVSAPEAGAGGDAPAAE